MKSINVEKIWQLSLREAIDLFFNKSTYIYLQNGSIHQGIITAIQLANNPNGNNCEHLPVGLVINGEFVSIARINHIDVFCE